MSTGKVKVSATTGEETASYIFCIMGSVTATAGIVTSLKAMVVNMSRPSGRQGLYASLFVSNPRRVKVPYTGISGLAKDFTVYTKIFFLLKCS